MSESYEIKDSGRRSEFPTGAVRDTQDGKGRFDLLPLDAIEALAIHYGKGCAKYGDRNWEKGIPISRYADSAMRHLIKTMQGLSDENHLIAAIWNLMCMYQTLIWIHRGFLSEYLNDLPAYVNVPNLTEKTNSTIPDDKGEANGTIPGGNIKQGR